MVNTHQFLITLPEMDTVGIFENSIYCDVDSSCDVQMIESTSLNTARVFRVRNVELRFPSNFYLWSLFNFGIIPSKSESIGEYLTLDMCRKFAKIEEVMTKSKRIGTEGCDF
jgi:hypothetical protein